MNKKRVKFAIAATLAAILIIIGATLAYFTDNATTEVNGTAGTVNIEMTDSISDVANFNPGDGYLIDATITNSGNKSVDVRTTFKLTMTPAASISAFTENPPTMGWAIYAKGDCTGTVNGSYVPNANASPIATNVTTDGNVVTATGSATEIVLNGTGTGAETESGVSTNIKAMEYVLVMLGDSDNSYQGATVKLDIQAEAKQHRNTSGVQWEDLEAVSTGIVPAANQNASGGAI